MCNQDLIFFNSNVGKGCYPSSVLKMGLSERFFIVYVGRNMCQWSVFQDNFNLNNNGIQSIKSYK